MTGGAQRGLLRLCPAPGPEAEPRQEPGAPPSWDILIAAIPHRHYRLLRLLEDLGAQLRRGITVRVFRDNLQHSIGFKRQALLDASAAEYVSFVDDDDQVAPDYADAICLALAARPDYVGFAVLFTCDGMLPQVTWHTLANDRWSDGAAGPNRDISHLNPIRRELALLGRWEGGYGEDRRWAAEVRATGRVRTEVLIGRWMYRYRFSPGDCAEITRRPLDGPLPALPAYPWMIATDACDPAGAT